MLSATKETQDPIDGSKEGPITSNSQERENYMIKMELDTWQCPGLKSLFV